MSSDDLVKRLRNGAQSRVGSLSGKALKQRMPTVDLLVEAADELERLQARVTHLEYWLSKVAAVAEGVVVDAGVGLREADQ